MTDQKKTKAQLIQELEMLRAKLATLEEGEIARRTAQEAEQRRNIELETLRQASLSLTASLDLKEILHLIADYALQLVKAINSHIFTYDGHELTFGAALWSDKQQTMPYAMPREDGLTYHVVQSGQPIIVNDMRTHPLFKETSWQGSILGLPLRVGQQICGVMTVAIPNPVGFTNDELRILELLGDQAAIAIQNAQYITQIEKAQQAKQRRNIELELLRQASLSLTASLDLAEILSLINEYALQLVEAMNAHIFIYDGHSLTFGAALWLDRQQNTPFASPREDGLTYKVARSGKTILVNDMRDHDLFRNTPWEGSIIGLPLQVSQKVRGVMLIAISEPYGFKESELRILELLADQAAIAIQNAQYVTKIEEAQQAESLRNTELEILRQASLSLMSSLDLEEILRLILEYALQLVKSMTAHIFTYDGTSLSFGAAVWDGKQQTKPFAVPRENGLTYHVARSGRPIIVDDMHDNPLYKNTEWEGSIIGLPLFAGNQVCGVMSVSLTEPRSFEGDELRILELLADQAAIAIQKAQYIIQIEKEMAERKLVETALRESEVRYRSLFENSPIPLREEDWSALHKGITDLQEKGVTDFAEYFQQQPALFENLASQIRILDINQATLNLYEAQHKSELYADNGSGLFFQREIWDFFYNSIIAISNKQSFFESEVIEYTLTGKQIYTLVSLAIAPEYHANWGKILISSVDITKRKEAEEQALILEKERTRASTLYDLIQAIAHDLRTPLTTISTSLYLLKKTLDEARHTHHIEVIDGQVVHLSNTIDGILTIARLDTLHNLTLNTVDINRALRETKVRLETLTTAKNLTFDLNIGEDELMIAANEAELHKALTEIIKNAVQFTAEAGHISIQTHVETEHIMVAVEDEGVGMTPSVVAQIFDRFYRADDARSTKTGGAGLGLAIAKKIIEFHYGRIEVESELDKGTIVRIWLPLHKPKSS